MSDENTLRMLAVRLHHARRNSRRTRRDDVNQSERHFIHLREQLHLEIGTLGSVFLNEVRFRQAPLSYLL